MDISNTKLTHGLLVEDFKQSILNIIMQHSLDIQSKSIVLEYILFIFLLLSLTVLANDQSFFTTFLQQNRE